MRSTLIAVLLVGALALAGIRFLAPADSAAPTKVC